MIRSVSLLALVLVPLALALGACSKKEDGNKAPAAASPLPKAEAERGLQACNAYVARLCACAESRPELAEECALAQSRPQAFQLNLELSATPGLSGAEHDAVKAEARKIAAACFEDEARLDPETCPRPAPAAP